MIVKGQMAASSIMGPTQGMPAPIGRRALPTPTPLPVSQVYWPAAPKGSLATAGTTGRPIDSWTVVGGGCV